MKIRIAIGILLISLAACKSYGPNFEATEKDRIGKTIDSWHLAASEAKFDNYFSLMTEDAVFIGTDPTENWKNREFKAYSKPHFDKGKAWSFTAIQRNIYISDDRTIAWFDELLDTQMKICRGSGILKKVNGDWKITHYVLSIAIPNENTDEVILLKKKFDDDFIKSIKKSSSN